MNQLWRGYISQLKGGIASQLTAILSPLESEKFQRLKQPHRINEFVLSRALMRMALSHHYNQPLSYWQFSESPNAAPTLENPIGSPLFISLSHSNDCVLLAISDQAVGLDVENMTQRDEILRIARKVFSHEQQAYLSNLPADLIRQHFYQLWTQKEALVKAMAGSNPPFQMISSSNWPQHDFQIQHGEFEQYALTLAAKQTIQGFSQFHAIPFTQIKTAHFLKN